MSDRSLYRGKRKDNGEWVYGVPIEKNDRTFIVSEELSFAHTIYDQESVVDFFVRTYEVIPETVGQFTGLTDMNGTKIFEGNIVHLYGDDNYPDLRGIDYNALVIFKDGGFCAIDGTPDNYGFRSYPFAKCDLNCEVIGNIHDDPELLREE